MVKIRLMRMGAKKRPFFRVVVADSRSPRDGRFIENIGKYHPLADPSVIDIDEERALHWLGTGAQPTDSVRILFEKTGIWERFTGVPAKPARKTRVGPPAPAAAAPAEAQEPEPEEIMEPAGAAEPEEAAIEEAGEEPAGPAEESG